MASSSNGIQRSNKDLQNSYNSILEANKILSNSNMQIIGQNNIIKVQLDVQNKLNDDLSNVNYELTQSNEMAKCEIRVLKEEIQKFEVNRVQGNEDVHKLT